jgi:hypothetical protein
MRAKNKHLSTVDGTPLFLRRNILMKDNNIECGVDDLNIIAIRITNFSTTPHQMQVLMWYGLFSVPE